MSLARPIEAEKPQDAIPPDRAAEAWAAHLAEILWNDPRIRARMSAYFSHVVEKMVEASGVTSSDPQ